MKIGTIVFIALLAFSVASCGGSKANNSRTNSAEIKKGVQPVADKEIAVIEMENPAAYGTIKIELYSNIAPRMVERFKQLAREGVYDGTTFHRINPMVVQGGDPLSKDDDPSNDGTGRSDKPNVAAEFSDILFDTGIVGAARGSGNDRRVPDFDTRYTIFGKVIEGLNNVRTISGVQPKEGERPVEPVRIKSVRIETRQ